MPLDNGPLFFRSFERVWKAEQIPGEPQAESAWVLLTRSMASGAGDSPGPSPGYLLPVSCPLASQSGTSAVWLKIFVLCGRDLEKHVLGLQCFSVLAWGPAVIGNWHPVCKL